MDKKTPAERSKIWQTRFTTCESDQQTLFKKASNYYDIMYAVQKTDNIAPWRSKIFVPILASKAWDLIARLSGVLPYFKTKINDDLIITDEGNLDLDDKIKQRQRLIDGKLQYDYQYGQDEPMKLKVVDTMLDAVVAGTGFAKAAWKFEEKKEYSRIYNEDDLVDDMSKEKVKTKKGGHNEFEPLNFFNVFISNKSKTFAKSKYVIVRDFKALDELKLNENYTNVDKLEESETKGTFDQYNNARNRVVNDSNNAPDETVPTVTIYECFENTGDGWVCSTYGEGKSQSGWVELEAPLKKYWHEYCPIQPFYIRKKSFSPWGESLFENNSSLQYATNDIFNHYMDNWNLSIDSMIMYEDGALSSDFVIEPGGEITYTGEKPDAFKFPEPNPAQLSQIMSVINSAVESATVPQYLSGVPNSAIDKTAGTATGITSISEAANEKIGYMRDNFKQSMVTIGRIWLSNLQQFQDKPEQISFIERGREVPGIIMPADYEGSITLTIDDDSLVPMSKDEKRKALEALTANMIMTQKAAVEQANILGTKQFIPKINFQEINEEAIQYYSVKDPARFILTDEDIAAAPPVPSTEVIGNPEATANNVQPAVPQGNMGAAFGGM